MYRKGISVVLWITVTLLLVSCRTVQDGQYYQDVHPEEVEFGLLEDNLLLFEVAYVGAIGHSFIFECTVENKSAEPLLIDKSQFVLECNNQVYYPNDEQQLINELIMDKRQLKKRKKETTLLNGIFLGLGVISGASAGLNAGEVLVYNADPIIAIFDERRWYQRNIESVEDEVEYIHEAQFNRLFLPPGEIVTRDLLFPTTRIKSDVTVLFNLHDESYSVTFPKKIFK